MKVQCEFCERDARWTYAATEAVMWIRHFCPRHLAWGRRLFYLDMPSKTFAFWPIERPDQMAINIELGTPATIPDGGEG